MVKNQPAMQEKLGLMPELRRFLGEGHGHPLRYSCLENPMDRGAMATVHGVAKEVDTAELLTLLFTFVQSTFCSEYLLFRVPFVHFCSEYLCMADAALKLSGNEERLQTHPGKAG